MDKYCGNCGHPLSDGAKFCANCGQRVNVKNENQPVPAESKKEPEKPKKEKQPAPAESRKLPEKPEKDKQPVPAESKKEPVKAKNEEQDIATESKEEPVKTNAIVTKLQGIAKKKEGGFIAKLVCALIDFIQHPKKLLPTIVLTAFWMVFPILSAFGANIPVLRFLYTLTYSNGGMFGGFFGAVGGIFGKAVFAAVVNAIVLSLIAKKNPFANAKNYSEKYLVKPPSAGCPQSRPSLSAQASGCFCIGFSTSPQAP